MNFLGSLGLSAARVKLRAVIRVLMGVLVLAFLVLAPLPTAGAHDAIEAADPADGSVLESVPPAVKLTFNKPPIALGAVVQVVDPAGINQSDGGVAITDNVVTQALRADAPEGRYTVSWRVVSSDSHPIEGRFTFTAGRTSGASSTAPAVPASTQAGNDTASPAGLLLALSGGVLALVAGLLARARLSGGGPS